MYKYAQLNDSNIVEGISFLSGEVVADNMIFINGLEIGLGSTYNLITKTFTPPTIPQVDAQPTLEEIQAQTLINTEYLIAMNEMGIQGGTV